MLEFVSSIINHRVNLGKLLKIFQVAKNHKEAFAGSNVYSVIRHRRSAGRGWERAALGRGLCCPRAPWPRHRAPPGFSGSCAGWQAPGAGAGRCASHSRMQLEPTAACPFSGNSDFCCSLPEGSCSA